MAKNDTTFKPGQSGNKNGRPRGTKNPSSPAGRIERALKNGYDLVDLKRIVLDYINDPEMKKTPTVIKDLLKTAIDLEIKLIELDIKVEDPADTKPNLNDDDEDEVIFKTTAD